MVDEQVEGITLRESASTNNKRVLTRVCGLCFSHDPIIPNDWHNKSEILNEFAKKFRRNTWLEKKPPNTGVMFGTLGDANDTLLQ